jgi:Ca-activated chloride channel family protein
MRLLFLAVLALPALAGTDSIAPGSLITPKGICPLRHTDVQVRIAGPLARVTVTQEFHNPFAEKIEAVYTFPLPPDSAVDDMTMHIGDRTIRGLIKPRDEARKIYEEARRTGHIASLLDQERPNIFTQAVANILPGATVKIQIAYVETVPYEAGAYSFNFPMVVAPRYMPRRGVPDAARIAPPVTPEGTRAGHDISVDLRLDAGVPIEGVESRTHDVSIDRPNPRQAVVKLRDKAVIPNMDFILKYGVAGRRIEDAVLTHTGYFTLLLQPPERVQPDEIAPKELVFVLDTSGSMSGFPIEKAKESMALALDGLHPRDTFNLITFAGDTHILFPNPVPATAENRRLAREFLSSRSGSGGTEMMKAIRTSLAPSDAPERTRVVCFMTDGEVGNDLEILAEVQRHPKARVFAFGIGSSVNHFLLDGMARYGRGEVEYVGLQDDGSAAARRFHERVNSPLLTDISIDWGGLAVTGVYPARIPDLFAAKPLVISGRYTSPGAGVIRLRGRTGGREFTREIRVNLPASQPENAMLATLWARRRVEDLMSQDFVGLQRGAIRDDLKQQITQLGMDYRLMTPFTSFVAVEEKVVTEGGAPRRVEVPVEMPEGMSYEGVFGSENRLQAAARPMSMALVDRAYPSGGGGSAMPVPIMQSPKAAPMRETSQEQLSNLDPAIAALIARVKAGNRPGIDEAKFVFGGDAYVRLTLTDASPDALNRLRQAGVVITGQQGNMISGHVPIAKLETVSKLPNVQRIVPR